MPRLTAEQFKTLLALGGGPSRCSGGNPCHTALWKRKLVAIRFVSRRDYVLSRTESGEIALAREIARKGNYILDSLGVLM
jgi:hypothetical protein